jgi:hypothetical protein
MIEANQQGDKINGAGLIYAAEVFLFRAKKTIIRKGV